MNEKQYRLLMRGMGVFAIVLIVLLAVGTFSDLSIAQAIYTPNNPLVIFISTLGLFPMVYSLSFLYGVLAQRSLASQKSQVLRIIGAVLCVVLAAVCGGLITRAVLSTLDGFGGIVGSEFPSSVRFTIGIGIGIALCAIGYNAAKANNERDLARKVLIVIIVLMVSFLVVELVKNFMSRPRPRLLFAGYEGIEFCPWYNKFSGAEGYMAMYDIAKDAFKSFPSGHSLQAASLLTAFYGLSLVYPNLREKLNLALVIEIVFTLAIMACRMILGAHFLSDVSTGAFVSVIATIVILILLENPSQKAQLQPESSQQLEEA